MKNVFSLFKEHYWVLIFSVFVGLIVVLPQIIFIYNSGLDYRDIYMMGSDAETHYLARMQEFYDGNGIGNPFIYEFKSSVPSGLFSFAEQILSFPGYMLGVSIVNISLFYKFFFPFILFILVYFLFLSILKDKWWAITGSLFIIFGHSLLNTQHIIDFLSWNKVYNGFISYARPINPQFSSLIFFAYLYNLFKSFTIKDNKYFYYLVILFGFSFYIYFYSFTFLFALTSVFILLFYFTGEKENAKKLSYVLLVGCILGIPAILSILDMLRHHLYSDYAKIIGATNSHAFNISSAWVFTLILFLWGLFGKQIQRTDYYVLGLLITSFLVINQQVLTGIVLQEGHYHWYFNIPIFIISLFWIFWKKFSSSNKKNIYPFLFIICILSVLNTIFIQNSSYIYWSKIVSEEQYYSHLFDWINKNTVAEDVVFANKNISKYIPIYTHNNVVWEDHASYYLLSRERREFTQENILKNFNEKYLKKYRIDYFIADKNSDDLLIFDNANFLVLISEDEDFKIYVYKN